MKALKIGKLDNEKLRELIIDRISYKDEQVAVKAGVGEDCAYLDFGEDYCVVSTDPITASASDIGRLAVNVSCNDIASCGVRPFAILMTLMLPEGSTEEDIKKIMAQAAEEAARLRVEIAGGHTEVTGVVNAPVIVGTAFGKASKNKTLARGGVKTGDKIVVTKTVGLEGISIMAKDCEDKLRTILSEEEIETAKSFADMTSVLTEGVIAGETGVSAMHDITEGGVLGAVWEICQTAHKGAVIEDELIPVEDITKKLCGALDVDYRKLISSGSMMIIVPQEKSEKLIDKLTEANIDSKVIGEIRDEETGISIRKNGEIKSVEAPGSDELYKVIN